jgi:hypothetical protein
VKIRAGEHQFQTRERLTSTNPFIATVTSEHEQIGLLTLTTVKLKRSYAHTDLSLLYPDATSVSRCTLTGLLQKTRQQSERLVHIFRAFVSAT